VVSSKFFLSNEPQIDFNLASSAYGLVDFDSGKVLASKNLSLSLPIASLTKIMTAVVALDLADPKEIITVSNKASNMEPTKVMLKVGEKVSLENLLKSMLIASANDSAEAIKEGVDQKYGEDIFIKAMNLKAQNLGLKNTHFENSAGLDSPDNYSSVEDLMILSHYALENYPLIVTTVSKSLEDLTSGDDKRFYLNNWNGLLGVYPGVEGIKIGNTEEAGKTTIVLSEREGRKLLAVVLGAPGVLERDLWASQLLDEGFAKMGLVRINVTEDDLKEKYASWKYPD
jgi:serine-type D-Ala-D-Ala carboxypeptidase (penicillin-binding protein 5/6)